MNLHFWEKKRQSALPLQRQQVQSLIVELRSQMLCGLTKKFKNIFSWSVFYLPDCFGEGNSNPLQYSCLGNPMDRGGWQATVHRITGVGRNLVTKPPFFLGILSQKEHC